MESYTPSLERQREIAQKIASRTGRVQFVLSNGKIREELDGNEPAFICEPHGYHPAI